MKTHFLFPHKYKKIGWLLFLPSTILLLILNILNIGFGDYIEVNVFAIYQNSIGAVPGFFKIIKNTISDELIMICIITGSLIINFSKLKNEDEYISKIRYESLVWATYLNYFLIVFFTIFIYGITYANVLFYNIFTLLIFFMIRFHFMIYKLNKNQDEE